MADRRLTEVRERSPVLSNVEACHYLRLTDGGRDLDSAVRALCRLVRLGKLRPVAALGRPYRFTTRELDRFLDHETATVSSDNGEQGIEETYTEASGPGNGPRSGGQKPRFIPYIKGEAV
jgi:hypothetical protein